MPLTIPSLFDRTYDQILAEALARIPVHTREWTNFNDSDPGVTLIQLYAFMAENLLYRANRIPERNRLKFLKLLGIPLQAAAAAEGFVSFLNDNGPLQSQILSRGQVLYAGQVPFRTLDGLEVLPLEAKVYYKAKVTDPDERAELEKVYNELYASYEEDGGTIDYYQTQPLLPPAAGNRLTAVNLVEDTIDGYLWVALLARKSELVDATRQAIAGKSLTLGIMPDLEVTQKTLYPGNADDNQVGLIFQVPKLSKQPSNGQAEYLTLSAAPSGDLLDEPGVVELQLPAAEELTWWTLGPLESGVGNLPPSLDDTDVSGRLVTWIRLRTRGADDSEGNTGAKIGWVGINAARVAQKGRVAGEVLGQGTGETDQVFTVTNKPIIPASLVLTVNGVVWNEIDDFLTAGSEVPPTDPGSAKGSGELAQVYSVDHESGEIRFGNGLYGARPPLGSVIQVSYEFGGGRKGMVGIGAITKGVSLSTGLKVVNPLPTWGGADGESVAEAERRIPAALRHRERVVTGGDFVEIVKRTPGVAVGRVDVLPTTHPSLPGVASAGVVTLMTIPASDPVQPDAPNPDRLFLQTICRYVEPRRLITTEVHVVGPTYLPIYVAIGIAVVPGESFGTVRQAVENAVRAYLSPLTGGIEGKGWPLDKPIERLELLAVAARVVGIAKINEILMSEADGIATDRISLEPLELPRLMTLSVGSGSAQALSELLGSDPVSESNIVPIPVIPSSC